MFEWILIKFNLILSDRAILELRKLNTSEGENHCLLPLTSHLSPLNYDYEM